MSPRVSRPVLESSFSAATPDCCRADTWSAIRAIRGETTRPRPGRTKAGNLVAEALAAAGGQYGERAASGQNFADHPGLQAAEVGVAEGVAQQVACGVEPIVAHV
jgi:hypothetical protein